MRAFFTHRVSNLSIWYKWENKIKPRWKIVNKDTL